MGLLQKIGKLVLIIVNIIFFLLGFSLIILGFVVRYDRSLYEPYLQQGIDELQTVLDDTNLASFDVSSINFGDILVGMSLGLILGGLFLCSITIFGCCGACYQIRLFLFAYGIIILVFLVLELITIGILYGRPEVVKDPIKNSMSDFKGIASPDVYSLAWNVIMIQYACCGVDDYHDFDVSSQWKTEVSGVTLETPVACCITLPTGSTVSDFDCCTSYNETLNNGMEGCYSVIWNKSMANAAIIVPILLICAIVQVSFIIFAFILMKKNNPEKVRPE